MVCVCVCVDSMMYLYCIQADKGDYGSSNYPVWEFEVWIPFINSSLKPAGRLPARRKQVHKSSVRVGLCVFTFKLIVKWKNPPSLGGTVKKILPACRCFPQQVPNMLQLVSLHQFFRLLQQISIQQRSLH